VYCYTSNLTEFQFEKVRDGHFIDHLEDGYKNNIYTRSFILSNLDATELKVPSYDELEETEDKLQLFESKVELITTNINVNNEDKKDEIIETGNLVNEERQVQEEIVKGNKDTDGDISRDDYKEGQPNSLDSDNADLVVISNPVTTPGEYIEYPELTALRDLKLEYERNNSSNEELKEKYIKKLINNFNQNGVF